MQENKERNTLFYLGEEDDSHCSQCHCWSWQYYEYHCCCPCTDKEKDDGECKKDKATND